MRKILLITLILFFSSLLKAQVNLNLGLAAHYTFTGNANDVSGNNHNPTFNNATLTNDRFGNPNSAYRFNGANNYIQIPNSPGLNFANQMSIAVWIKPMGFYYGTCHGNSVVLKGDDANFSGRWAIRFDDGQFLNYTNCSTPLPDTVHENYWGAGAVINGGYTPFVTKNEWVSVVHTYDGTNAKLYINCNLVINNVAPGLNFSNSYDLLFGKTHNTTYPYWYNGILDDVRIYNRPLNEEEIFFIANDGQTINASSDVTICEGDTTQLNVTGGPNYSWTPSQGLSNGTVSNPLAYPLTTTKYYVFSTFPSGCIVKDSVTITVNPLPVFTKSEDTVICSPGSAQLAIIGGNDYIWTPSSTLNDPTIANPIATPSVNTMYHVMVTNIEGCSKVDSVYVEVRNPGAFSINGPLQICENKSVQLLATGGDMYSWTPVESLSNAQIPNPIASPGIINTAYTVTITDTVCNNTSVLSTTVSILSPPTVGVSKSNDIDCSNSAAFLMATGALNYLWNPDNTLSDLNSPNPIATPLVSTTYIVTGFDLNGCEDQTSITVKVTGDNKIKYLMPTAFTPNKDGLNDCYGITLWGHVQELEFSIYNRWGERVFFTRTPSHCWDGKIGGVLQDPGVFVYMIRAKTSCENYIFRKGTFALIR